MTALTDVTTGNTALASDENQCVDRLNRISGDTGSVSINGGTSGTATCYQSLQETVKYTLIILNNFRTAASTQNLTLPVAYTLIESVEVTDSDAFSFQASGVDITMRTVTAWPSGAGVGGTTVAATTMNGYSKHSGGAFSVVQFKASWAAAHTGTIVITGT